MTEKNNSSEGLSRTSLHSWHKANEGKLIDFGGWDMPLQYGTGILKEHLSTRRYGGLFDVSKCGILSASNDSLKIGRAHV